MGYRTLFQNAKEVVFTLFKATEVQAFHFAFVFRHVNEVTSN